jgi:hypothetical protein
MKRAENILFALFAHKVNFIDRKQFIAICGSLRHGKDIDLGMSLARRGMLDDAQAEALWKVVDRHVEAAGTAKKAINALEIEAELKEAMQAAVKPQQAPKKAEEENFDPPTLDFDFDAKD